MYERGQLGGIDSRNPDMQNAGWKSNLWNVYFFFQDFMEDVNIAFQYLLKLTPLLDKADQRCK